MFLGLNLNINYVLQNMVEWFHVSTWNNDKKGLTLFGMSFWWQCVWIKMWNYHDQKLPVWVAAACLDKSCILWYEMSFHSWNVRYQLVTKRQNASWNDQSNFSTQFTSTIFIWMGNVRSDSFQEATKLSLISSSIKFMSIYSYWMKLSMYLESI